jgi:hypothetical protein
VTIVEAKPPSNGRLALFQATDRESRRNEECCARADGRVGLFDFGGANAGALLESGKWQRIAITVDTEKGVMTTFVGGQQSTQLTSDKVKLQDGRFAVPPAGLLLFASRNPARTPGVKVRYVEFRNQCLAADKVQQLATRRFRWNKWAVEEGKKVRKMQQKLYASVVSRRPRPIWQLPATLAEFGDKFLGDIGVGGSAFHPAAQLYEAVFRDTLKDLKPDTMPLLDAAAHQGGGQVLQGARALDAAVPPRAAHARRSKF